VHEQSYRSPQITKYEAILEFAMDRLKATSILEGIGYECGTQSMTPCSTTPATKPVTAIIRLGWAAVLSDAERDRV
jgi:hypothetical protein